MSETNDWQAPLWLTDSYLEEVLKKYLQDDTVRIQSVDFKPATAKGENYASVMTRIKISFNAACDRQVHQDMSFIMKCSYENDPFVANIMAEYDVYNTEMKMYEQILPQLAVILREVGHNEQLFAKTLKVDYERNAIIFEDLAVKGFVLADRLKGLDGNHVRLVLNKLAKLHAAAAVLNERLGGALEQFDHGFFNTHTRSLGSMFEHFTGACANFAKRCPSLGSRYHDKLMKLQPHIVEYATRAYRTNPKHFFTLSHGDLWINNMMMLYKKESHSSEQQLKDVVLVDFQFCNWSTPAVDLHYFFNTSLEPHIQVDMKAQAELVQFYHSVLSAMLRKLKYSGHIPTLHEFRDQFEEGKILAVTATLANNAVATADQCDDADFRCLVDDSERARKFRESCYKNKRYQDVIKTMLPYFDRCGLLDVQH